MEKKVQLQRWQREKEKVQDIVISALLVIEGFLLTIVVVGAVKVMGMGW